MLLTGTYKIFHTLLIYSPKIYVIPLYIHLNKSWLMFDEQEIRLKFIIAIYALTEIE